MSTADARVPPGVAGPQQMRDRHQAVYLASRGLGAAAIIFVVAASFWGRPAPGGHGRPLAVAACLAGFALTGFAVVTLTRVRPASRLALLAVAVLSASGLIALRPGGPGFLGVFPAVAAGAIELPARLSGGLAGLALAAVTSAWLFAGHVPVAGIVLNDFGVAAFYLLAMLAHRLLESNERAAGLLAELEQTRAAQAQAAALSERQRLAREMHDVLAHSLSGLVLNLEGARLLAGRAETDARLGEALDRAHRLARSGLEEARRAIGMLRDDDLPGPERLADLVSDFERDSGVRCPLTVTGLERDLGSDGRLTLYRVAQEALTNVHKHARPCRVEVRLAYDRSGTTLTVEDFAAGEPPPPGDGSRYGLAGMKERAELLGGTLTAGPTGSGFLVELRVPP